MSDAILEAQGLSKHYEIRGGSLFKPENGLLRAVDNVDIKIRRGETVALVGESGSGKTTLSRLLLLLEKQNSGKLFFNGQPTADFSKQELMAFRKSVQPVFQNPFAALNPKLRAGRIIAEPLKIIGKLSSEEIEKRVLEVLQKVGMHASDANKYPHQFSGGQRQRIAIARALASEPELIILDEPVASQDISIQAQILNLLKDLQNSENLSFLFIAHDLATVRYLSDKIYVMYFGKTVESGTTEAVFSSPKHPYTQNLFAAHLPDHPTEASELMKGDLIGGEQPNPIDPPKGCSFQTRCPKKQAGCEQNIPDVDLGEEHRVSCTLYSNESKDH